MRGEFDVNPLHLQAKASSDLASELDAETLKATLGVDVLVRGNGRVGGSDELASLDQGGRSHEGGGGVLGLWRRRKVSGAERQKQAGEGQAEPGAFISYPSFSGLQFEGAPEPAPPLERRTIPPGRRRRP